MGARLLLFMTLLALGVPDRAVWGAPLSAKQRRDDPRLENRVTIRAPSIYIAELLERLSDQTGVPLAAGKNGDGAGDERVTIFAKDMPLGNLMEALWALMSYRDAAWHWSRIGTADKARYELLRPRSAQLLADRLEAAATAKFHQHAQTLMAAATMPPAELQALRQNDPTAAVYLESERFRLGMQTLTESLPPLERWQVLRGEQRIRVPVDQLPESGRRLVRFVVDQAYPPKTRQTEPRSPSSIEFSLDRAPGNTVPTLYIDVQGLGAYGYLGGRTLHREVIKDFHDLWLLPGDASSSPEGERPVRDPQTDPPPAGPQSTAMRLEQLAAGIAVPVLARLPRDERISLPPPYGMTAAAFLRLTTEKPPYLQHKWRTGAVLFSYAAWYVRHANLPAVPYEEVKWLRERAAAQDGFLFFSDLARAAARLDPRQLMALEKEFPPLRNVAYWREVLRLAASGPGAAALKSRRGMSLNAALPALRSLGEARLHSLLQDGRAHALRIREENEPSPPQRRRMHIEVLARDGSVLTGGGFVYERWKPLPDTVEAGRGTEAPPAKE